MSHHSRSHRKHPNPTKPDPYPEPRKPTLKKANHPPSSKPSTEKTSKRTQQPPELEGSKDSKQSGSQSGQSHNKIAQRKGSAPHMRRYKSKELASQTANPSELQPIPSTHKKKKSSFSTTAACRTEMTNPNKPPNVLRQSSLLGELLEKSESVLEQYRERREELERENCKFRRKYEQVLKRIRNIQSKK